LISGTGKGLSMRSIPIQTNFTTGEISPRLYGRVDLSKYRNGTKKMSNFIIHPHGGISKRSGFKFVSETKDSSKRSRLIPFQFSVEQAYVLEFGDGYVRFYMDGGQIMDGEVPYEIASPYSSEEIGKINFCQSADVLYLAHPDYITKKLMRKGHADWEFQDIDVSQGPFEDDNDGSISLTASAKTGTGITITASDDLFEMDDVGRYILISHVTESGIARITNYNSATSVTADVTQDFADTTSSDDWGISHWSDKTGWPSCITFYQQRLCFASTKSRPQTVWMSKTDAYEDFRTSNPLVDDDSVELTLVSEDVNTIKWMSTGKNLRIGTVGGEWSVTGSDSIITPGSIIAHRHTTFGSDGLKPANVGNVVLFAQRSGRKLREYTYNFESDGYVAPDMTLLAEHISVNDPIREIAFQQNPDSILWCVKESGEMAALTYMREHDVVGWARHSTEGSFESVCSVPVDESGSDELWVVVKRTVNGEDRRYVELMQPTFFGDIKDAFFVDSGLVYEGEPVTELSGLDHLEGETVQILADGSVHGELVVVDGTVSLARSASKACVGLGYDSEVETLNIESGANDGTAQGRTKRVYEAIIRIHNSLGMKVGTEENLLSEMTFRTSADPMGGPPELFTGDKNVTLYGDWNTHGRVYIKQEQPLPLTILAIITKVLTNN